MRADYEARFVTALRRITAYLTADQLRRRCEGEYGLEYCEALEMAYDNVRDEARNALRGYRPKKRLPKAPATTADPPRPPRA